MQINSNELMLINKMNARYNQAPQPVPIAEGPVTKPEYKMNALEAQAHNNVMFQGMQSKMMQKARKVLLPLAMMAVVGAGALNQSCTPIEINQTVDVAIDMNAVLETLNGMKDLLVQNNEQNEALLATLERLIAQVEAMKGSQEDFYAFAVEYMMNDAATQTAILEALEKQGLTQEEINAKMDDIYALMNKKDYEAALDEIKDILFGIGNTLNAILAELQGLRDELNKALEMDRVHDQKQIDLLEKIWNNGDLNLELLQKLVDEQKISNAYAEKIVSMLGDLQKAMDENHEETLKYLQNLDPSSVDYSKFEAMFKELGLDLAEVIDLSRKDLLGAANEILNAIKEFNTDFKLREDKENDLFGKVISLLEEIKELEANSPDYNAKLQELKDAIEKLKLECNHECNHEINVDCDCNGSGGSTNEGELYG